LLPVFHAVTVSPYLYHPTLPAWGQVLSAPPQPAEFDRYKVFAETKPIEAKPPPPLPRPTPEPTPSSPRCLHADPPHPLGLMRARRERPRRCRATEQGNEVPPSPVEHAPPGTGGTSLPQGQDAAEAPAGPWGRPESF
jgi:hypothetical protein